MTSQGLEADRVAELVIGVDALPGAVRALTGAADEAWLWLASLRVVHP